MFLDPIRFRYSTETIVEEPVEEVPAEPVEAGAEAQKTRRRRRKSGGENKQPAPEQKEPKTQKEPEKKEPKVQKEPEQKPAEAGAEAQKTRRRPHHRRRKPKQQSES